MMRTKVLKMVKKRFLIKEYLQFGQLKKVLYIIKENNFPNLQISILGKSTQEYSKNKNQFAYNMKTIETYWKNLLGPSIDVGFLSNPEIGKIFVVGSLTSIFLHEIEGKALGAMSTGLYGILRGLGAHKLQTEINLKALDNGSYLLIVRGCDDELSILEDIL